MSNSTFWTRSLNRLDRWEALALGAGMNARGVVQIVVAMVGLRMGMLTTETYTVIVLVAIPTSLKAPPIIRYSTTRIGTQPRNAFARSVSPIRSINVDE